MESNLQYNNNKKIKKKHKIQAHIAAIVLKTHNSFLTTNLVTKFVQTSADRWFENVKNTNESVQEQLSFVFWY